MDWREQLMALLENDSVQVILETEKTQDALYVSASISVWDDTNMCFNAIGTVNTLTLQDGVEQIITIYEDYVALNP